MADYLVDPPMKNYPALGPLTAVLQIMRRRASMDLTEGKQSVKLMLGLIGTSHEGRELCY